MLHKEDYIFNSSKAVLCHTANVLDFNTVIPPLLSLVKEFVTRLGDLTN